MPHKAEQPQGQESWWGNERKFCLKEISRVWVSISPFKKKIANFLQHEKQRWHQEKTKTSWFTKMFWLPCHTDEWPGALDKMHWTCMEEQTEYPLSHCSTTCMGNMALSDHLRLPADWLSWGFVTGAPCEHARAKTPFPQGVKLSWKAGNKEYLDKPAEQLGDTPGNRPLSSPPHFVF